MEDIFNVKAGHDYAKLPAGTVSGGLDGQGHLGFAAQPGLQPFGRDVFSYPRGYGQAASLDSYTVPGGAAPGSSWARDSLAAGAPLVALMAVGGYIWYRRRALPGRAEPAGLSRRSRRHGGDQGCGRTRASRVRPTWLGALLLIALAGCSSATSGSASSSQYGSYPSFLPSSTLHYHSDTVLTGTVQRPALTNQGTASR